MRPTMLQLSLLTLACAFASPVPAQKAPVAAVNPATPADLALADLDLYQRGLQLEIDTLKTSQARLLAAREAHDDVAETTALQPVVTRQYERNAAKTLGVELHRYREVKTRLGDILVLGEYVDQLNAQLDALPQTGLSAKQRADQRKSIEDMLAKAVDPYALLDAALRDALKARADALVRMRIDNRDLVQELTSR